MAFPILTLLLRMFSLKQICHEIPLINFHCSPWLAAFQCFYSALPIFYHSAVTHMAACHPVLLSPWVSKCFSLVFLFVFFPVPVEVLKRQISKLKNLEITLGKCEEEAIKVVTTNVSEEAIYSCHQCQGNASLCLNEHLCGDKIWGQDFHTIEIPLGPLHLMQEYLGLKSSFLAMYTLDNRRWLKQLSPHHSWGRPSLGFRFLPLPWPIAGCGRDLEENNE